MARRTARWLGVLSVSLPPLSPTLAQDKADPTTDPAINDAGVPDRARSLDDRPVTRPLAPTTSDRASTPPGRTAQPRPVPPLRREGSFIVREVGTPVRLNSGELLLVFHKDAAGQASRPVILTRSETLERIEREGGDTLESRTLLVSGQILQYRGTNYLLPSSWRFLDDAAKPAPAPPDAVEASPGAPAPPSPLEGTMQELESHRSRSGNLAPATAGQAGAESNQGSVLPEGSMLVRRRARLIRVAPGQTGLAMDTDADTAPATDPLMILSPCQAVEQMEQLALAQGEALVFEVTGRALVYRGRNYLMPVLFQVNPPGELERRQ